MQIGLPPQNLKAFPARHASFKCQVSPLNPLTQPTSSSSCSSQSLKPVTSTEMTRQHLANLEKILRQQNPPNKHDPEPVYKDPNKRVKGLNLAKIWPLIRTADEMPLSPKHMNRLQRLLSKTDEYSPRNSLRNRWREYHGCNDWAGLLDPLDENLRREVVRYGEFVQSAYQSFHSNPAMSAEEPPLPLHVALPDRSYRVTKSLYATSSIGLPSWVDDVAPDLGWMTQRSSWVGYVAVCDDKREIARMGRRDIVIALRGTATCLEWAENFRAQLTSLPDDGNEPDPDQRQPKVECGFLSLFKTRGQNVPSLAESVVEEVHRLMQVYKGETLSITVTGHSLGAALAVLVADEVSTSAADVPPVAVFSFGGPRVGNQEFADRVEAKKAKVLRIVNEQDVITRVPVLPLAYSHVGTELRVDTKMSPYLKPNADVACCHDLEAYLHLVDGFLASNCPFRPNAKRSLVRLLQDQRSNVKKLYTSKAKALSLSLSVERERGVNGLTMSGCLPSPS